MVQAKAKNDKNLDLFAVRSVLFLPASNPRAIAKAHDAGADLVVLDLEDAVKVQDKAVARKAAVELWKAREGLMQKFIARLNSMEAYEIPADKIPTFARALSYVTEVALNTHAEAIGVRQLESILDEEEGK